MQFHVSLTEEITGPKFDTFDQAQAQCVRMNTQSSTTGWQVRPVK